MALSIYDFHLIGDAHQQLAIDHFTKSVMDALQSIEDGTHIWNNVPFVNSNNKIDPLGGGTVAPGKGSHSHYPAGNGLVKMKKNAGTRNGMIYTMLLFITPSPLIARGEFYMSFNDMYKDAKNYLKCFSANGGCPSTRHYWSLMSNSVLRILRFYPRNIHPDEALNACEMKLNRSLFENGKLYFCNCANFDTCKVNLQVQEVLKYGIMVYINLKPTPASSLSKIFGTQTIKTFVTKYATSVGDDYQIEGLNLMKISKSHF